MGGHKNARQKRWRVCSANPPPFGFSHKPPCLFLLVWHPAAPSETFCRLFAWRLKTGTTFKSNKHPHSIKWPARRLFDYVLLL